MTVSVRSNTDLLCFLLESGEFHLHDLDRSQGDGFVHRLMLLKAERALLVYAHGRPRRFRPGGIQSPPARTAVQAGLHH